MESAGNVLYLTFPHESLGSPTSVPIIPGTPSGVPVDSMCMECNGTLDSVNVHFVVGVTIYGNTGQYGNTGKYASVIYHLEPFFNVNSMVMSIAWSELPYVAILANVQVLYIIWNHFSVWIQWWCLLRDWSHHIWQYQQIYKCYISSGTIFQCEFNGDAHCVIRVTIYGNTSEFANVIYHLEPLFNVNSTVMFVLWSEWPQMAIETKTFLKGIVKAKIQDSIQVVAQLEFYKNT